MSPRRAIPIFEELGDDRGLARTWLLAGWVHGGIHGQEAERERAAERALIHYRRSGFPPGTCLGQIAAALYYGPAPVGRAISRCEELLLEEGTGPLGRANINRYLGGLMAMAGAVDRGRELVRDAAAELDDLGQTGRRGTATRSWPTSSSWRATSLRRDRRSRHSARTARRARTSDCSGLPHAGLLMCSTRTVTMKLRALAGDCSQVRGSQ